MNYLNILPYIFVAAAITFSLRLLPFLFFKDGGTAPDVIQYLGKYLPPAIITGITVYCFKSINFTAYPYGIKELLAAAVVTALHLWKRNTLLSVFVGTVFYMIAVQKF